MTHNDFLIKKEELKVLSKEIPLKWGKIQNNIYDSKINMFSINSKEKLEECLSSFPIEIKNYYKRRWFLWQCSKVDEYLFCSLASVQKNPNPKDQQWDIKIKNTNHTFDIKGTKVPKSFMNNFSFEKEKDIIDFYYKEQSGGIRYNIQNRLFIVHHSFASPEREMFLRCHWDLKENAYCDFVDRITNGQIKLVEYKNVYAKIIYIIESENFDNSYVII